MNKLLIFLFLAMTVNADSYGVMVLGNNEAKPYFCDKGAVCPYLEQQAGINYSYILYFMVFALGGISMGILIFVGFTKILMKKLKFPI